MVEKDVKTNLDTFLIKWALSVTAVSIIPFLLLYYFGENVFAFSLGSMWAKAGKLAILLIPYFWGALVVSPISALLIVVNRQGLLLIIQVLFLLSGFGALWFGHRWFATSTATIFLYSLVQCGVYVIYFVTLLWAAKQELKKNSTVVACAE